MFVRFGTKELEGYVDSIKDSLEQSASASGAGTVDLSGLNISDMLFGLALGLIFFGLFLVIVSVLGCCGSCCKLKVMLITVRKWFIRRLIFAMDGLLAAFLTV